MPIPTEQKTIQARVLSYAQAVGSTFVSRADAELRRSFNKSQVKPADKAKAASHCRIGPKARNGVLRKSEDGGLWLLHPLRGVLIGVGHLKHRQIGVEGKNP